MPGIVQAHPQIGGLLQKKKKSKPGPRPFKKKFSPHFAGFF